MPLPLTAVFADLPDPRVETANKLHKLTDILVIATCAVIAGADGWEQVAEYGRSKEAFFRRFLGLPNGVPSHDTFERVFARLDPDAFADRFGGCGMAAEVGEAHGREEERYVTVVQDPDGLPDGWKDVGAVALVCRERQVKGQKNEGTARYYLTSLRVSAAELAGYVRNHWAIENGLHWVLDVAFREDDSRTRAGHAAANLGLLRRVAVSLLKRAGTKGSIQTRRMKAGWDDDYLLQVLQGITAE